MRLFNPYYYYTIHLIVVSALSLLCCMRLQRWPSANSIINRKSIDFFTLIYTLAFIVIVGLRPLHGAFGDMVTIAHTYDLFKTNPITIVGTRDSLFYYFQWSCAQVMEVEWFFLICEVLYVVPILIACYRFFKKNFDIGILFFFAAFSFFSYATNGVRNGIATSMVIMAASFIQGKLSNKIVFAVLAIIAANIHNSVTLPILCLIVCYFFKLKRGLFVFWLASIVISLLFGSTVSNLFANLGFDDRLNQYITAEVSEDLFSRTGFRWDFLLYSSIPVLFGYYLIYKKHNYYDSTYLLLLGTYILSNSFWIMVIRAEYSNRFAFLSWFLYPLVICYPLLKLKLWPKTQGNKAAMIMIAHLAFTLFMVFVLG